MANMPVKDIQLGVALNFLLQSGIEHNSVSKYRCKLVFCRLLPGTAAGHMKTFFFCKTEYLIVQWRIAH
jgi:hypothetical protein